MIYRALVAAAIFAHLAPSQAQEVYDLPTSLAEAKSEVTQLIEKPVIALYTQIMEPERVRTSYYDVRLTEFYHNGQKLSADNFPFRTSVGKYNSPNFYCNSPNPSDEIRETVNLYTLYGYDFFFLEMKSISRMEKDFLVFDKNPNPIRRIFYRLADSTSLGADYIFYSLSTSALLKQPLYGGRTLETRATPFDSTTGIIVGTAIPPDQLPASWGASAAPNYLQTVMMYGELLTMKIESQRHTSEPIRINNTVTFLPVTYMNQVAHTMDQIDRFLRTCNAIKLKRIAEPLPFPDYGAFFGPPG